MIVELLHFLKPQPLNTAAHKNTTRLNSR